MISDEQGSVAVEYILVAVIMSVAALMILGPGSVFFAKVGEIYRAIVGHVAMPGNWIIAI